MKKWGTRLGLLLLAIVAAYVLCTPEGSIRLTLLYRFRGSQPVRTALHAKIWRKAVTKPGLLVAKYKYRSNDLYNARRPEFVAHYRVHRYGMIYVSRALSNNPKAR
ncbi:hypothetical protein [Levilactobacillus acidifarinae]|uniref:Uncharacterized protein n=1 Tax=Levilactobacillus acidifarinae DSM 19394 = JCM 15949 TaxID=1423715 RepID=A0A0R1LJP6_9LACO|nr:hypothetical protein [Levilactobacillus acidifarinae]KRK96171.1 hypothetical protein FD25_GL002637 [Levilactobacillus acidifarinae DSM 19394]GEO69533.1 hypothetical protein LAC03_14430 [Levilactobacillus acidifarinae]